MIYLWYTSCFWVVEFIMMFHWCSKKMWIQLQCDEGHESTCRWAGNVMTTMAMTGATERTGMTGVTERNGGSWNLSESRRTGENLRIPKPFKKIGGWLLHNVCSITPRLMMDNSLFSECFFFWCVFFNIFTFHKLCVKCFRESYELFVVPNSAT